MMNELESPVLDHHLLNLQLHEERCRAAFYAGAEEVLPLTTFMLEALADFVQRTSGKAWPVDGEEGHYSVGLAVSFIRTQFLVVRCAEQSHLIEGATLLRKQIELLARLNQIDDSSKTLERLLRKVPDLRVLKSQVAKLYGSYSEIAHSSVPEHFRLLGSGETEETSGYLSLYPKFSPNSYVFLTHAGHAFLEFWVWLQSYNERHGEPWDLEEFNRSARAALKVLREWKIEGARRASPDGPVAP